MGSVKSKEKRKQRWAIQLTGPLKTGQHVGYYRTYETVEGDKPETQRQRCAEAVKDIVQDLLLEWNRICQSSHLPADTPLPASSLSFTARKID